MGDPQPYEIQLVLEDADDSRPDHIGTDGDGPSNALYRLSGSSSHTAPPRLQASARTGRAAACMLGVEPFFIPQAGEPPASAVEPGQALV